MGLGEEGAEGVAVEEAVEGDRLVGCALWVKGLGELLEGGFVGAGAGNMELDDGLILTWRP